MNKTTIYGVLPGQETPDEPSAGVYWSGDDGSIHGPYRTTHEASEAADSYVSPPPEQEYLDALASMDWRFEFSDDARVVREGTAALKRLHALQQEHDPDGAIWRDYAPEGNHIPQPRTKP